MLLAPVFGKAQRGEIRRALGEEGGNPLLRLVVALIASAVTVVLEVVFGTNDDDAYTLRVIDRVARRAPDRIATAAPGVIFLEIDGLALPNNDAGFVTHDIHRKR